MTGSDGDLEYLCRECGMFFPAGSKRCPRCGTESDPEEESIEALLEELTALLNDDLEDGEADVGASKEEEEGLPDKAPRKADSTSTRPDGKVRYKKVKKWPR